MRTIGSASSYTPTLVRKSAMAVGHTIAGIALAVCALTNSQGYLLCLVAIGIGCGAARAGPFAFSQTLADPRATGKWTGLQNGFAKPLGCRSPGAHWISSGSDGKVSGPTRDRRCGLGGWRPRVGFCGRPSRTS